MSMRSGSGELGKLVKDLNGLPSDFQRSLRPQLRTAAGAGKREVGNRASWSHRIPGATTVKVYTNKKNPGIFLRVSSARAPHARPYEGMGGRRSFRHPVFGSNNWVTQATRPFLRLSAEATVDDVVSAADRAVIEAARRAGFR